MEINFELQLKLRCKHSPFSVGEYFGSKDLVIVFSCFYDFSGQELLVFLFGRSQPIRNWEINLFKKTNKTPVLSFC